MLADGWRDLFLSWVPDQVVLDFGVDNEDGLQVMNVFPLDPLREDVHLRTDIPVSNLWQLGLHVESEAAETLHVDAATCLQMLLKVLDERFPDDKVLCFGLQRLHAWGSAVRRHIVLPWILVAILQNPKKMSNVNICSNYIPNSEVCRINPCRSLNYSDNAFYISTVISLSPTLFISQSLCACITYQSMICSILIAIVDFVFLQKVLVFCFIYAFSNKLKFNSRKIAGDNFWDSFHI